MGGVTTDPTPAATRPSRSTLETAIRYLLVGGLAFAFDVGILALLHEVFGVWLELATPLAFVASFFVTFLLQGALTFQTEKRTGASLLRYAILVAANTLAVTAIVSIGTAAGAPWLVGKIVAVVVTTIWNFFAYRHWVFPATPSPTASPSSPPL
jgi:putative flippase GtrA